MFINRDEIDHPLLIDDQKLLMIGETILNDYYDEMPDFSVTFVSPERIQELNRDYRGVDAVTDVLSFESDGEIDPETGLEYLGDIVVCPQQAEKQAEHSGHPFENEICLLVIHGILHLLGYDHMDEEQREEMWERQNMYLDKCGVKLNRRPGEDFDF